MCKSTSQFFKRKFFELWPAFDPPSLQAISRLLFSQVVNIIQIIYIYQAWIVNTQGQALLKFLVMKWNMWQFVDQIFPFHVINVISEQRNFYSWNIPRMCCFLSFADHARAGMTSKDLTCTGYDLNVKQTVGVLYAPFLCEISLDL